MADLRRPNRPGSRDVQGRTNGRGSQSRRPPQKKATTPVWVLVLILGVPLIGIGVFGTMRVTRKAPEPPPAPVVEDPNKRLNELTDQVGELEGQMKKLRLLSEKPEDKAKVEEYKKRLFKWRDEWNSLFADKMDAEGNILPEYRGYQGPRNRVNTLINYVNKVTGF